jgi:FtsP/CotA-like multicopper oxidase with cupredoxin domain
MSTLIPGSEPKPTSEIDYHAAEGLNDAAPVENPVRATAVDDGKRWREWIMVAVGLTALVSILAIMVAAFALATGDDPAGPTRAPAPAAEPADEPAAAEESAPTLADAKGVAFEPFERVDPTLPPTPAGEVKKFEVDVFQHVTQVSKDLAPTEIWSFAVNGKYHRGTGVSAPMVVTEGDTVDFTLTNGSDTSMKVDLPHSLDFHSAEVNPGTRYKDLAPGDSMHYRFVAKHPGVFMYHCATQPVLMHTGAGMVGMFVVKPKDLAPVDKELWITQQEYYLGKPGGDADMAKMAAKKPDVIAFNGYANQYQQAPISVRKDEKVRMYVLNAGPSVWSAFHVIGTVFDRTMVEGTAGHDAQTINLAPSQGGWVEFTLDEEGTFPFVNHAFGDMVKGSLGILATPNAPKAAGHGSAPAHHEGTANKTGARAGTVGITLGDMWIKSTTPTAKAGKVTFDIKNEGATLHGFAIVEAPAKAAGGMLDESGFLAKGKELGAGEGETLAADLGPGAYELVCFLPGHYMAGQKLPFKVQ